eukprot:TRINITY_DN43285_c0_g1_i1.p1 TRINITY_DN43285_c0_g1~~TRINITY_DN43285_c0_g1_i1.p1  ORF type:complete len:206 (-),score=44.15 TRINITY_DN43285_c0_g1_i1:50-667(-)
MAVERVKILLVGPERAGKSAIANYLAGFRDTPSSDYKPTVALRIHEYEATGLNFNKNTSALMSAKYSTVGSNRANVELWDVSGSPRYTSCWPAIMKDVGGIIFVFNPEMKNQERDLENWHQHFAIANKVKDQCCLVLAHKSTPGQPQGPKPKLTKPLMKIKMVETSLEAGQEGNFRAEVDRLVEAVVITRRETEENQILDGRSTM